MSLCTFLDGFPPRQRALLVAALEIYGDDTNTILNAFQEVAARVAVFSEVSPEKFAEGVKHHWDHLARLIDSLSEK